jgi:hypothetical protein
MKITYQSKNYSPQAVLTRYVKYHPWDGEFAFCEVGKNRRHDLRQGTVEPSELPTGLASEAIAHVEVSIHYLTWPL